jgi:hypothetical protein
MSEDIRNSVMPPEYWNTPIQRFRDAVRTAAQTLLSESSIAPRSVAFTWKEGKAYTTIDSLIVAFEPDQRDEDLIYPPIMPFYEKKREGE